MKSESYGTCDDCRLGVRGLQVTLLGGCIPHVELAELVGLAISLTVCCRGDFGYGGTNIVAEDLSAEHLTEATVLRQ